MDILNEESLETFSSYYPKLVKAVKINKECGIPTFDPQTGAQMYHRYKIPKLNPEDDYIGIERFIFQGQGYENVFSGFNSPLADAAFSKIRSLQPVPPIRYVATFEAPDFCLVNPFRQSHTDFTLVMQRKTKLNEIPNGLQEYFLRLYTLDCKLALYNEFPNARDSGTINGVEVNTSLADYSNAESDRVQLLDVFEEDFQTNPDRFEAIFDQIS